MAAGVGLLAGAGAAAFVAAEHALTHLLWRQLPAALGLEHAPWWLALLLPVVGAAIVAAAIRLPGHGGHGPLDPFALDIVPAQLASVVLAALGSLAFGAVLGPEATLLAIGTAAGAAVARDGDPRRRVLMLVGGMAAVGAVFGNPLVTLVLLLELALVAGLPITAPRILVPALTGLGAGYLLQVGVGPWTGLGEVQLRLPDLPAYPEVRFADLLVGVVLAVVVALLVVAVRAAATAAAARAERMPALGRLLAAGAVVGAAAAAFTAATGRTPELIAFAGQATMGAYLTVGSAGLALAMLAAKSIASFASLAGGFKGGAIFPAIALGAILAGLGALLVGPGAMPALAATAIAAATTAAVRLPLTGLLLAVLLTVGAGGAVTVSAILGAVVALLLRLALDARHAQRGERGARPDGGAP